MPSQAERLSRLERIVTGQDAMLAAVGDGVLELADPERVTTVQPVTARGLDIGFQATTDYVDLVGPGPHPIAVFDNPETSGVYAHFDRGDWSAKVPARFRRIRSAGVQLGASREISNRGGGPAVSACRFYGAPEITRSGAPGVVTKVLSVPAYLQSQVHMEGDVVLRPGRRALWTVLGDDLKPNDKWWAAVSLQWWESSIAL